MVGRVYWGREREEFWDNLIVGEKERKRKVGIGKERKKGIEVEQEV